MYYAREMKHTAVLSFVPVRVLAKTVILRRVVHAYNNTQYLYYDELYSDMDFQLIGSVSSLKKLLNQLIL